MLASPGWAWLQTTELDHWRNQMGQYLKQAANERDDVAALNKLRQIVAAKEAVERVFKRPEEELRTLQASHEKSVQPRSFSRRGPV